MWKDFSTLLHLVSNQFNLPAARDTLSYFFCLSYFLSFFSLAFFCYTSFHWFLCSNPCSCLAILSHSKLQFPTVHTCFCFPPTHPYPITLLIHSFYWYFSFSGFACQVLVVPGSIAFGSLHFGSLAISSGTVYRQPTVHILLFLTLYIYNWYK